MEIPPYDLKIANVTKKIRRLEASKILLQLPEGLRPLAFHLVDAIEKKTNAKVFLSGDSCYGACDLAVEQAKSLNADLLVHYGHSKILPDRNMPILYVEARLSFDVNALVEEAIHLLKGWKKIGLASTVQHVHLLQEVAEAILNYGIEAHIGVDEKGVLNDGQVLGCDYSTVLDVVDRVEGYLFVGGGLFHPIGLAINTAKKVIIANPYTMSASQLDGKKVMLMAKKRMAAISASKKARFFGIIVSLKPGQFKISKALSLQEKLRKEDKESIIICLNNVEALSLGNFSKAEAFINTACPRIGINGMQNFGKPMLTVTETEVMLGDRKWENVWIPPYL